MRRHLQALVAAIEAAVPLGEGELVVDIGANDGTTLLAYRQPGLTRVAYEPSNIRPDATDHGLVYIPEVFNRAAFARRFPGRRARVITSIAMFYDLDDPAGFCRELFDLLEDDGVWVLEMSYLGDMLRRNSFDAICHEHLGYYGLGTLTHLLAKTGFELADVRFNDANGGSLRAWIQKRGAAGPPGGSQRGRVATALADERGRGDDAPERLAEFREQVEAIRRGVLEPLEACRRAGRRVYGYGASTKGNVLLQACGLGPQHLVAIADRNPGKHGRLTPGTRIPICSEAEMRQARPELLLVLPWHFLDEFLERERELRAGGTRFLVPFPHVRVV
jgi:hypothetical protein